MDTPTFKSIDWIRAIPHLVALFIAGFVVQSLHVFQDWTLNFIAGWSLIILYRYAVRFSITRYHTRGMQFVKAHKFHEAIQAFQENLTFFEKHSNLDKWRSIIFLSPGKYGYREMTLLNLGYSYGQIGDGAKSEQYYKKALDLNPQNGMAAAALNLLNAKRDSAIGQAVQN